MSMDAPIISITQVHEKFRACLHKGTIQSGNSDDKIETHEEANEALDRCCAEDYGRCRPAYDYLRQKGYAIRKNFWVREPIEIKQSPQKYQVFFERADRRPIFKGDGRINTDEEMHEAIQECRKDVVCDHREMYHYYVRIEEPHLEERALMLFFMPTFRMGGSTFYTKLLGTNQFDIPTHPEDVGTASASGPIQIDKLDGGVFQSHLAFGLDFWQYAFVKAQVRLKDDSYDVTCVRQRYADNYDAYTGVCFEQRRSQHLTVGFYPFSWGMTERDRSWLTSGLWDEDFIPSKETMYNGLLFSVEAGLASAEFKYYSGWHRWGGFEIDGSRTITRDRFGLAAAVNGRLAFAGRKIMLGLLELGLAVDYFPNAYYDFVVNLSLPMGVVLDIGE
jgi:hypothetical protein